MDTMIKTVLMCPPTYFDIEYSINPYMDVNNRVNKQRAAQQWQYVYDTLKELGITIQLIDPAPGCPDMTFVGDAGMVYNRKFLATNFRHVERQGETPQYIRWMQDNGFPVYQIPQEIYFEGLGDIIYFGADILFGYGPRSSPGAIDHVRRVYPELNLIGEVHLKDASMYHLGLAAALINKGTIMYYPEAFTDESQRVIERLFERRIPVGEKDAKEYFVCNNIPIGNKLLMDNCSPELERHLKAWGYEVIRTDMSEFKKSGGSVRCLILAL